MLKQIRYRDDMLAINKDDKVVIDVKCINEHMSIRFKDDTFLIIEVDFDKTENTENNIDYIYYVEPIYDDINNILEHSDLYKLGIITEEERDIRQKEYEKERRIKNKEYEKKREIDKLINHIIQIAKGEDDI